MGGKETLFTDRPWEPSIRADWAEATPEELLNEIIRLRRGMDGVRSRSLCGHHKAAEDLHCWTWNGNDPNEWKPAYGRDDERAYREQVALNERLREIARAE